MHLVPPSSSPFNLLPSPPSSLPSSSPALLLQRTCWRFKGYSAVSRPQSLTVAGDYKKAGQAQVVDTSPAVSTPASHSSWQYWSTIYPWPHPASSYPCVPFLEGSQTPCPATRWLASLPSPQLCGFPCAEQALQVDQDEGSLSVDPASAGTSDTTPRCHSKMTAPTSGQPWTLMLEVLFQRRGGFCA